MLNKNLSTEDKITKAKIHIYKKSPFFSYILLHMNVREGQTEMFPPGNATMAVDNEGNMWWHRDFVNKLSHEQLMGVLAHEICHIAFMHLERGERKDRQVFNVANDLIVNDMLQEDHFSLPKCGMIPENHEFEVFGKLIGKINEKSSEELYAELYPLAPKMKSIIGQLEQGDGKGQSNTQGMSKKEIQDAMSKLKGMDNHIYGNGKSNGDESSEEGQSGIKFDKSQKWKKIIAEAVQIAKQQGKLPAGIERRVEKLLNTKINWKGLLYKYVVAQIPFDYSWSLPHKRGAALGIYLPRAIKESVHIICSIDTSGSINQKELQEFLSEMVAIAECFPNIKMDIVICDAKVHETYEMNQGNIDEILSLKMSGGGGTDHRPIYEYVQENIMDAKILINFTDGYTSFPKNSDEFNFESMWVICSGGCDEGNIPFGEVIKIE